ncbi:MAG: cytochrome c maturation protein CcmE [Chitinophagales bacterium]|jgi:cytochrome c-type biogenesis protein CcmE|nr:cytochrome c maturation protein CcmE [Chitinophagales bacterium]
MKPIHIISILLIAFVLSFLIFKNKDNTSYEDFQTSKENTDKYYHIVGNLDKTKSQIYDPLKDPNHFVFVMIDNKGNAEKVIYKGVKPDGFDQAEKIVIAGNYNGNAFHAQKILMKCPSKYEDKESLNGLEKKS